MLFGLHANRMGTGTVTWDDVLTIREWKTKAQADRSPEQCIRAGCTKKPSTAGGVTHVHYEDWD